MLAGTMGLAVAQTSTTTKNDIAQCDYYDYRRRKCWDAVAKQVRNETPSTGSSMSGTSTSSTATGSPSTSSSTKPPETAGLPDCKH